MPPLRFIFVVVGLLLFLVLVSVGIWHEMHAKDDEEYYD